MVDNQVQFPDTVAVLKGFNGSIVFLVGTAHFSNESQEDVAQVIKVLHITYTQLYNIFIYI